MFRFDLFQMHLRSAKRRALSLLGLQRWRTPVERHRINVAGTTRLTTNGVTTKTTRSMTTKWTTKTRRRRMTLTSMMTSTSVKRRQIQTKKSINSSTRNTPSIFSVSSLLSDEKTTRKEDRLVDEKEEDEITLPSTLHQQAFGKPSFFYPGMTRVFKWAIPAPYFDYFNLLTVNSKYVKDNFWLIQPKDLWYRKLRQLSHSHYP